MATSPAQKDIERLKLTSIVDRVLEQTKEHGVHTLEAARRVVAEGALTDTQRDELAAGALSSLIAAMHRE